MESNNKNHKVEEEEVDQNIDLDKLIEKRRREENRKVLKEKLQNKLKTIRDRRTSGVNNEPFPAGAFEQLQNNNIWEQVLWYLTDPSDVTSAYFTCRTFAKILEERRMLMMLPKVLNVFKSKVDETFEVKGLKMGKAWFQYWNSFCLNARGVCKAWKAIVDFHSDTARDDWILTTEWYDDDNPRTNVFRLHDAKSIDQVASLVTKRGLTVSPVRDIRLNLRDRISQSYYKKLLEYLKAHGGSVRFLLVDYGSPGNIAAGVREKLCDILQYLKNLKGLELSFDHEEENGLYYRLHRLNFNDAEEMPAEQEQGQDIQQGLNQRPLPDLPSLKHFIYMDWQVKEALVSEILRKYENLKTVDLLYSIPNEREITEALMELNFIERFAGRPRTAIITSGHVTWPLKHLEIKKDMGRYEASVLFPAINRFRETLQHLVVWELVKMDDTNVSLDLPHLKSFFLDSICRGTMGLDQLLPLKSLEKIIIRQVENEDENARVKVKTYLDCGNMHRLRRRYDTKAKRLCVLCGNMDQSNVWQCFPYLKRLGVGVVCKWFHRPSSPLQVLEVK